MKSMRRVLKCDGLIPAKMDRAGKFVEVLTADIQEMKAYVDNNRHKKCREATYRSAVASLLVA